MRRLAVLVAAPLAGLAAVSAGAAAIPNPCTAAPAPVLTKPLGAAPSGKLTSQTTPGGPLKTCTFTSGAVTLRISLGPAAVGKGGFGGPPGMVVRSDAALGPGGRLAYDTNPKFTFASATFAKGAFYGSVWSNKLTIAQVVVIAKSLYAGLR